MPHLRCLIPMLAFAAMVFMLAGCAHYKAPPAPGTKVVFQDVVRETQRPCPVAVPERPGTLERPLPEDAGRLVDLLTAKLKEWAGPGGYGDQADAALRTCTKD